MADRELTELRKQCITSLYLCTDNICKYLDEEKEAEFNKLRAHVEQYCILEAKQEVALQALETAKSEIESDASDIDSLDNKFQQYLNNFSEKRLNINNHPFMLELIKKYKKGQHSIRQHLDESDLAITESLEQYIDPITKKQMSDPVKNTVCGHSYERQAILNLIAIKPMAKCPVAGCGNRGPIMEEHLLPDEELKFRLTITTHSTMIQERSIMNIDDTM